MVSSITLSQESSEMIDCVASVKLGSLKKKIPALGNSPPPPVLPTDSSSETEVKYIGLALPYSCLSTSDT
jgi:hypothetical protein